MGDGKDKAKKKSAFGEAFSDAFGNTTTSEKEAPVKKASFNDAFDDAFSGTQAGLVKKKEGGESSSPSSPSSGSTDTNEDSQSSASGEVVVTEEVKPTTTPSSSPTPIPTTVNKSLDNLIPGVSSINSAAAAAREAKAKEAAAIKKTPAVDPVTKKKENPFRSLATGNTAQFVNFFADANKLLETDIDLDNNTKLKNFGDFSKSRNPGSLTSIITSKNGLAGGKMPTAKDQRIFEKQKVLTDPENLRQYNLTRQKEMKQRADEIRNRQAEIASKSSLSRITDLIPGVGSDDEADVIEMNNLNKELEELGSFEKTFIGAVADVAKVTIPQKHLAKGTKPTNEEIGLEFLKTIGDPTVSQDEKDLGAGVPVTDAIDLLNWNKNQRALDYSKEKIRYKFEATGAQVMADFYSHASDRAFEVAKPKIEQLANLHDKYEAETVPAQKNIYGNAINTLLMDDDVRAYMANTEAAGDYYQQTKTAMDKFPQVKREQIRRDVNDAFFAIVDDPKLFESSDIKGLMRKFGPANWIFGETPSKEDIAEMAKVSGHTEDEVKEAMKAQREGFFASAPEGVRMEGFLTGIAKSVDETLGKTVQGARRMLDTDGAPLRNRMLGDKMEDYMYNGTGNDLIDKYGNYHVNPYSVSSVFGRGIGQMTIYGGPALVTGGIGGALAEGVGASLKAANTASKISEGVGTVLSGMAGSYEDAYKEAALQSSDESVRRGYATLNSLANALPELFYSPAEMLKGTGNIFRKKVIPNLFKEFSEVAAKKGVSAAIYNGLGKSMKVLKETGDVLLSENIEEAATNLGTNTLDEAFFNKKLTPAEIAKQAEETFVMTTLQTLPMAVGAGIHGANDISHVKKQGLFEAGVEPDLYKEKLKDLFDSGALNQAQYNEKVATVNTMQKIVSALPKVNEKGQPLSHDDKVLLAAQQYRIQVNNRRAATTTIEAEKERVASDTKEASAIQQQILAGEGVYMLDGQPVSREDAAKEIENGTGKLIQISNDVELQKRLNEVGHEVFNAKADVDSYTSGRVAEVANKVATNQPLTEAEHSIIEANKDEVLSTLEAVPEVKAEEDPETAASSLLAEALKAEPVVEELTPEQQSAVDVLHGIRDTLPNHYKAMVDVDPLETIKFIAEQAHESKAKKKTVEQKFGADLVNSAMKLFPPKAEVGESGKSDVLGGVSSKGEGDVKKSDVVDKTTPSSDFSKNAVNGLKKIGQVGEDFIFGGFIQEDGQGGYWSGDTHFKKDGTIEHINSEGTTKLDAEGNVIETNVLQGEAKVAEQKRVRSEAAKEAVKRLKATRDANDFKYTKQAKFDALGNKTYERRLKTDAELEESTKKINDAIAKAEADILPESSEAATERGKDASQSDAADQQKENTQKVSEKKPSKVDLYLSTPNSDGSFNQSSGRTSFTEGASIYALKDIGGGRYEVYFDGREQANKLAMQYPDKTIDPIFEAISAFNPKAKTIQTVEPAIVELENGKLKLVSKGKMDYDRVGIERENAAPKNPQQKENTQPVNKTEGGDKVVGSGVEDFGYHGGNLMYKSDTLRQGYRGDMPFTGHYFFSNRASAEGRGNRSQVANNDVSVVDFSKYNLLKPTTNEYWSIKSGLKRFEDRFLRNGIDAAFASLDDYGGLKDGAPKLYKEILANKDKIKKAAQEWYDNELENINTKEEIERLETIILKELGYEGVDVRGLKEENGERSPDSSTEGSVIFDIKPESVVEKPKNETEKNKGLEASGYGTKNVKEGKGITKEGNESSIQEVKDNTVQPNTKDNSSPNTENDEKDRNSGIDQGEVSDNAKNKVQGNEDADQKSADQDNAGQVVEPVSTSDEIAGTVIGKTKTGKSVIVNKDANAEEYKDFTEQDHKDAASMYNDRRVRFKLTAKAESRSLEIESSHTEAARSLKSSGTPTDQDMRDIYQQAFGKEYDPSGIPLPLAYKAALRKLKKDNDAIQEQSTAKDDVRDQSGTGPQVRPGNEVVQEATGESEEENGSEEKEVDEGFTPELSSEGFFQRNKPTSTVKLDKIATEEMPLDQAKSIVNGWDSEAEAISKREDNSKRVIISLFDFTGRWSQPWDVAGFTTIHLDIQHEDAISSEGETPTGDISYDAVVEALSSGERRFKIGLDLAKGFPNNIYDLKRALKDMGYTVEGVLSATPCTTFAGSGARHWKDLHDKPDVDEVYKRYGQWASKVFETPHDFNKTLVAITEEWFGEFEDQTSFSVMENPVGRIARETGLPPARAQFQPHNFGDPYTKKTMLWGKFNPNLPLANVNPTEGSKMQSKLGSKNKVERSATPLGFAYSFFVANYAPASANKKTNDDKSSSKGSDNKKSPSQSQELTKDVISKGESALKEAEDFAEPFTAQKTLNAIEDAIEAINKKVKEITGVYTTDGINAEYPNNVIGKRVAKQLHSIANLIAKNFNWEKTSVHPNIAPAGGEVNAYFKIRATDGKEYELYIQARFEPSYGTDYDNYELKGYQFMLKHPAEKKGYSGRLEGMNYATDVKDLVKKLGEVAKRFGTLEPFQELIAEATAQLPSEDLKTIIDAGITPADVIDGLDTQLEEEEGQLSEEEIKIRNRKIASDIKEGVGKTLSDLLDQGISSGKIIIGSIPKNDTNENTKGNKPATQGTEGRDVKEPVADGRAENKGEEAKLGDIVRVAGYKEDLQVMHIWPDMGTFFAHYLDGTPINVANEPLSKIESIVTPPVQKTDAEKAREELRAARAKFKASVRRSMGNTSLNPTDLEFMKDGIDLLASYAKYGFFKLSEIIRQIIEDGDADFVKDERFMSALRKVYGANLIALSRDQRIKYDTIDEVEDFFDNELPGLIASIEEPSNPSDFAPLDQQFDTEIKSEPHIAFKDAVVGNIIAGTKQNIISLRKLAAEKGLENVSDIEIQELSELAVVELTRAIAQSDKRDHQQKLAAIAQVYENQPSLNQRSSTRIELQQYSTPAPISYLGGHFINGISPERVFEPSAGNGLLTIAFPTNIVSVNEIDETRLRSLELQNFRSVSSQDATKPFNGLYRTQDGVITNPPFGTSEMQVYDGYKIKGLAPQMAINALETMKDSGRAAIIIGGHNSYDDNGVLQKEKFFFNYLYNHYNVVDVINIDGQLYSKQGTTFDIRMILINGRKSTPSGFAPTQSQVNSTVVKSFAELDERIKNLNYENIGESENGQRDTGKPVSGESQQAGPEQTGNAGTVATETSGINTDQPAAGGKSSTNGRGNIRGQSSSSQSESDGTSAVSSTNGSLPINDATVSTGTGTRATDKPGGSATDLRPNKPVQSPRQLTSSDIAQEKIKYEPVSEGRPVNTVIPTQMASEAQRFLNRIDAENGGLDNFVLQSLGYNNTEELYNAFSAEQIDAIAMSIYQIENNNGMVIGDMTGVGKGRIAAGIIRYGVLHGFKPIFLTEKTALFSDIYRDLKAIGSKDLVPFIVNDYDKLLDPTITDEDGTVVYKSMPKTAKKLILENQELPEDAQWVVASYSQFRSNPSKPSVKREFFRSITQGNILIMDESHNAGGDGNTGELFQDILENTKGVTYLSATFAKTPKNMPVYSVKTAMREANMTKEQLIEAIEKGGVALQEVVSSQLVEAGQMLRRERNFDGVNIDYEMQSEHEERDRTIADKVTDIIRDVIQFQENHVKSVISNLNAAAQADAGSSAGTTSGTSMAGVSNAPFASRVFNVVDQFLFAIKAEAAADAAIEELKKGRKPVLKFKSTMESFLTNEGFQIGDELASPDFSLALKRSLDTVMRYTTTSAGGDKVTQSLSSMDLFPDGRKEYARIMNKVKEASIGISISPIDLMIHKIEKAGYTVGEITGRKMVVKYNDDGSAVIQAKGGLGLKEIVRGFNSGTIDVVMLNASGATGISLHASGDFKDQRQRVMISPQLELDINKEIQGRGRIDRTGQVIRGAYRYIVSSIPAELRLLMMFQAKVKSLDANTTSSQKSKTSQVDLTDDFLNKYGDEIVTEYLKENPEVNEKLLDPLKLIGKSDEELARMDSFPDAARKTSGRVAILSSVEQEKFYKEVGERYKEYLEYKNSINENELEVKVLPLEAKTLSTSVAVVGKGGVSPFGADSILEKVDANILRKPMTKDELVKQIEDGLNGRKPDTIAKDMVEEMENYFNQKIIDDRADINRIIDEKKTEAGNTISDPEKLQARLEELENSRGAKMAQMENKLEGLRSTTRSRLSFFKVGRPLKIPTSSNVSAGVISYSNGVFLGFEIKANTKNRYAPSNVRLKFAVEDSRKQISVPSSQSAFLDAILAASWMRFSGIDSIIPNWGKGKANADRGIQYIVTGNVLQAYSEYKGQLVSYSTDKGELKKGILLNEAEVEGLKDKGIKVPFNKAFKFIETTLENGGVIISTDGDVELNISRNRYMIEVPKTRQRGGKYFLSDKLRDIVNNGEFVTVGNKMVSSFDARDLPLILDVLTEEFGTNVNLTQAQAGIREKKVDDNPADIGDEFNIAEEAVRDALPSTMDFPVRAKETAGDALNRILKGNGPFAGVARQILQFADNESLRVPFEVGPISDGRSYYDPISDTIYLTPSHANSDYVVLHEIIHAATAKKLPQGLDTIDKILDFINDPASDKNAVQLAKVYLQALANMDNDAYGLRSLDEFISEVFTNPFFQRQLDKIAYSNTKQNLFQRFIAAVKSMLGISSATLLDKAVRSGARIISNSSRGVERRGRMKAPGTALQDALTNMAFLRQQRGMNLGDFISEIQATHGFGSTPAQKSTIRQAFEAATSINSAIKAAANEKELQRIIDGIDAAELKKNVQKVVDALPKTTTSQKIDPNDYERRFKTAADALIRQGKSYTEIEAELGSFTASEAEYVRDATKARDMGKEAAAEIIAQWKDAVHNGKAVSRAAESLLPALLDNRETLDALTDEFRLYEPQSEAEAYDFAAHFVTLLGPTGVMEYFHKEKNNLEALYKTALLVKAIEGYRDESNHIGEANAATELRKHITYSAQGLQSAQAAYRWLHISASLEAQQAFVQNIIDSINARVEELPAAKAIIQARDQMREELEKTLGENENIRAEMEDLIKKHQEEMAQAQSANPPKTRKKKTVAEKTADAILKLKIKDDPSTLKASVFGAFVPLVNAAIDTVAQAVRIGGNIIDAIEEGLRDIKSKNPRFNLDDEFRKYVGENIHIPSGNIKTSAFVQSQIKGMVTDVFNGKTIDEVIDDRFFYLEDGPKGKLKRLIKHEMVIAARAAKAKLKNRTLDEHLDDLADELNAGGTVTTNNSIAKIAKAAGLSYITPAQVAHLSNILKSANNLTGFQKAERIERVTNFLEQRDKLFTDSFLRSLMYLKPLLSYTFAAASIISNKFQVFNNAINTTVEDLIHNRKLDTRYLKLLFDSNVRKKANALATDIMLRGGIPIQNQLALLMPFSNQGMPKSRLEEYQVDTTNIAKRWYNRLAQVMMSGANRLANVTDSPATYRIAQGELYQSIKDRIRVDQPTLTEKQVQDAAWAEMNAVSLQDAIAQADAEYTNRGVIPFGKYSTAFIPKAILGSAAATKGIITSENNRAISREDAKYRRRVAEIMDESRDAKFEEEYVAAIKTASDLLFKERIGDSLKKSTPNSKRITNGVGGLFTSVSNLFVNGMDAAFGNNKYTKFLSQNLVFSIVGYVNAAGNIMEKVLEADPRYAVIKIAALQYAKRNLSAEDKKYITQRQVQVATNSMVSLAVMTLALAISKGLCKDKAIVTKGGKTDGDTVTGNLSICGMEIPVQFFPIQGRMLEVYSNIMNDPKIDEKKKESVFQATWIALSSIGWDFFETDPGQYDQNITKAINALMPQKSPFPIGEKKEKSEYDEKVQNWFQGQLASMTLNYVPISPTFFNQTAKYSNFFINNGKKYYRPTGDLDANSFVNFMNGYKQELANKSGYQSIINTMSKDATPYLDYRGRPVDRDYNSKRDAIDTYMKKYESSVNMFSKVYSPIYDSKKSDYRTMTDKEHYNYYKESTSRVDAWLKENYPNKQEMYDNYVETYGEGLKAEGKKVRPIDVYFIEKLKRAQSQIKKQVIEEQFGKDALKNE